MRGFGFRRHGTLDDIEFVEVRDPEPGPGEVRLRVRAAAFNHVDRFVLAGIPGVQIDVPHVLGSDAAGIVESVGEGVTDLRPGAEVIVNPGVPDATCPICRSGDDALCRDYRIVGEHTQGTTAPYLVVARRSVHARPERVPFPDAGAVGLVFQTAWRALTHIGQVHPGDRVAIIGAGGGVTTAAVQVAKLRGATVAVASRSAEKAERACKIGADAPLVFDEEHPLDRVLWEWSGKRGVDVIFDANGAATLGKSVRALARGGRVVVVGATTGPAIEFDARILFWRQASIRGSTMANSREFEEVLGHLARGDLHPVVDSVHPFEDAADAFRRLHEPDLFGKVVVEIPP